ncbi:ESCRT-II complex vps25 subunit [Multifurca ochricompacta]|uniref:ESCRT-II complex vps25 subunit n=1 Tax=Multifurca ochricompacta TaxID=376703 RepID=A0AAD4QPP1_9AGAM|nr:ESCRT-II complex vps25 subunit [Multifurca ochricompacta]
MSFSTYKTPSGFLLPSIHSAPPFFTQQPNAATQVVFTEQWTRLILAYARYRRLFTVRVEDAEVSGGEWDEVLRNPRINRRLMPGQLAHILSVMVSENLAMYEPAKQTRATLLYWRLPEEWAEVLYEWQVVNTGQLNTILTFYEISEPPVPSELSGIPQSLLRSAIAVLVKGGRAQLISISDGDGVRFFPRNAK